MRHVTTIISPLGIVHKLLGKTRRYYTSNAWLRWLLCILVTFVPIWLICYYTLDPDFGWHLRSGEYVRQNGIPAYDIFSYTASSFRWINHEWGNDVLMSYAYDAVGYLGLSLIYAALWAAGLLIAAGRRANPFVLLLAAMAIMPAVAIRPTVVTFILFASLLVVLRGKRQRLYWYIPLVLIVWANLHAGFISGLALIGYFAIYYRSKQLILIGLLSFAATFLNAYGIRIYEEIFRTLHSSELRGSIQEWASFYIPVAALPFVDAWIAGFWLYDKKRLRNWFGLGPLLLLASISASRNLSLFVLVTVQQVPLYFSRVFASIPNPRTLDWKRRSVLGLLLLGAIYFIGSSAFSAFSRTQGGRETIYPTQAVAYLQQHPCPGQIFNNYNYGGYLIWKLPQAKVFIDGRMPTWDPYMERYVDIVNKPKDNYKAAFAKYGIECAILSNASDKKFMILLRDDGWQRMTFKGGATLWVSPYTAQRMR